MALFRLAVDLDDDAVALRNQSCVNNRPAGAFALIVDPGLNAAAKALVVLALREYAPSMTNCLSAARHGAPGNHWPIGVARGSQLSKKRWRQAGRRCIRKKNTARKVSRARLLVKEGLGREKRTQQRSIAKPR